MYIYICIYVSVYVCRGNSLHVYSEYVYMHTHTHVDACMFTQLRVAIQSKHTHKFMCNYKLKHIYTCVCTPLYLNLYIYIFIYIYISIVQFRRYNSSRSTCCTMQDNLLTPTHTHTCCLPQNYRHKQCVVERSCRVRCTSLCTCAGNKFAGTALLLHPHCLHIMCVAFFLLPTKHVVGTCRCRSKNMCMYACLCTAAHAFSYHACLYVSETHMCVAYRHILNKPYDDPHMEFATPAELGLPGSG